MAKKKQELTPLGRIKSGPPEDHDVVQTLRDVMKLRGMTQQDVARACGYFRADGEPNASRVSAWVTDNEKYRRNISLQQLQFVCKNAFDMTLVAFFTSSAEYHEINVAMTEMNQIQKDLSAEMNEALLVTARLMRKSVFESKRLKEKVKSLK